MKLIPHLTRITKDQDKWLRDKKRATGISMDQTIRDAIYEKMQREKHKAVDR